MLLKIHKFFWSYEKEENWLNSMSAKGFQFVSFTWGTYMFEKGEGNKYKYRIELLENAPSNPESQAYIEFVEETGAECICTYMRWVYFKKKTSDGPFELYTDNNSKIAHFKRILYLLLVGLFINFGAFMFNLVITLIELVEKQAPYNLGFVIISFVLCSLIGSLCFQYYKKITKLKHENLLSE